MAGNINIYKRIWNLYYHKRENAFGLKNIIEQHELLINDKLKCFTQPLGEDILVIDITLSIAELKLLTL